MKVPKKARRFTGFIEPWLIHKELDRNIGVLKEMFENTTDVIFREFIIRLHDKERKGVILYVEGLVNSDVINRDILERIVTLDNHKDYIVEIDNLSNGKEWMDSVIQRVLSANNLKTCDTISEVKDNVLNAQAVMLIDGVDSAIVAGVEGFSTRGIGEPESSVVVRGPREGFIEVLRSNTALLRRKIKDHNLKTESLTVGRTSRTNVCLVYINGIVNPKVLEEVKTRIERIDIDAILESGYIEELIEDNPFSPFPSISTTERPDDASAALLEGRIIIIVDNTPFVLCVPMVFEDLLHASEDYYNRYMGGTAIRLIRFFALFISVLLPSIYIAVVTYHPEMLPTPLLISVAAAREGVPFPAIIEAFLMEFTFEALKEAGARMPKAIGSTVSIVGGLILGEAAVSAGLVSQPMVIVVAGTAISSFAIPGFGIHSSLRFIRFPFMILAGIFGLYGIILGGMVVLIHLCSLRSYGVPYMAPFAPLIKEGLKDSVVRAPWWSMKLRPQIINWRKQRRNRSPRPSAPVVLLVCMLSGLLLTGCWDMEEINDRAIVNGVAVDLVEDENGYRIKMLVQIIKPGVVAGSPEGGGGNGAEATWVVSAEGKNVNDAARNLTRYSGRNLYWSHNLIIIVSEELAKQGVGPVLDFFDRTPENRLRTWFIVANGTDVEALMKATPNLESLLAVEVASMIEARAATSLAAAIYLRDFLYFSAINTRAPVASAIETYNDIDNKTSLLISGSAVFKNDKLIDFYDELTTRGILWVVGDVNGGIITIDWEGYRDGISTDIIRTKTAIDTFVENGNVRVNINVEKEGNITEVKDVIDISKIKSLREVELKVSDEIKREINLALAKAQEQTADIFGIGEIIRRQHPKAWRTIETNWEDVFSEIEFQVEVETHLRRYGVTQNRGVMFEEN
ncbi:Ger(x)C family spore germination protein [Desulfuribacillus alkaliarsenatis]|uniref:Uncharacterized protein n=1 Tax=Desulfuribacillus alkaliarsenatis TaxID=766136 RepID=A0A1E5G671_9FIRM|nr:Ger(x)C family spore germination protein [Desulfuribacillus alkaliarsenatis]OEF98671.1 hypothetical protein BHF68_03150 [Desulfuribacillus alkaliarsenatis]